MKENKFEKIENTLINVSGVELETSRVNVNEIARIKFNTDKGEITWKARKKVTKMMDNFKIVIEENYTLDDIPEKLKLIADICAKKGKCEISATYTLMKTEDGEGTEQEYRFVQSEKVFGNWTIKDSPVNSTTTPIVEENVFNETKKTN